MSLEPSRSVLVAAALIVLVIVSLVLVWQPWQPAPVLPSEDQHDDKIAKPPHPVRAPNEPQRLPGDANSVQSPDELTAADIPLRIYYEAWRFCGAGSDDRPAEIVKRLRQEITTLLSHEGRAPADVDSLDLVAIESSARDYLEARWNMTWQAAWDGINTTDLSVSGCHRLVTQTLRDLDDIRALASDSGWNLKPPPVPQALSQQVWKNIEDAERLPEDVLQVTVLQALLMPGKDERADALAAAALLTAKVQGDHPQRKLRMLSGYAEVWRWMSYDPSGPMAEALTTLAAQVHTNPPHRLSIAYTLLRDFAPHHFSQQQATTIVKCLSPEALRLLLLSTRPEQWKQYEAFRQAQAQLGVDVGEVPHINKRAVRKILNSPVADRNLDAQRRSILKKLLDQNKTDDQVRLVGWLTRADVPIDIRVLAAEYLQRQADLDRVVGLVDRRIASRVAIRELGIAIADENINQYLAKVIEQAVASTRHQLMSHMRLLRRAANGLSEEQQGEHAELALQYLGLAIDLWRLEHAGMPPQSLGALGESWSSFAQLGTDEIIYTPIESVQAIEHPMLIEARTNQPVVLRPGGALWDARTEPLFLLLLSNGNIIRTRPDGLTEILKGDNVSAP